MEENVTCSLVIKKLEIYSCEGKCYKYNKITNPKVIVKCYHWNICTEKCYS